MTPKCQECDGKGVDPWGETCIGCGGSGRDQDCCERCSEPHVGANEDGEYLCEDCMFEAELERQQKHKM